MVEVTKEMIHENIYGSTEVQDALCINRSRLNALVKGGKLNPIKQLKKENLFYKPEVDRLKREMQLDSRTNLYKQSKGENADDKERC
jgi:hypothetical protein